jgi:putative cell wall-binding protein
MFALIGTRWNSPHFVGPLNINAFAVPIGISLSGSYPEYHSKYETSLLINRRVITALTKIIGASMLRIANTDYRLVMDAGERYPETIAAAGLSAKEVIPILLTKKETVPRTTGDAIGRFFLRRKTHYKYYKTPIFLLLNGSEDVISPAVEGVMISVPKERIAGKGSFETAAKISAYGWPEGAKNVIIVSGEESKEGLSAVQLAGFYKAPILPVTKDEVPDAIKEAIMKLQAKNAIIVGRIETVSSGIEKALEGLGLTFERITGANQYEIGVKCAEVFVKHYREIGDPIDEAILVGEERFSDAAVSASLSVFSEAPTLITGKEALPESVKNFLQTNNIRTVYIIGENVVISEEVESNLKSLGVKVTRIAGADKYETATKVLEEMEKYAPQFE